MGFVLSVGLLTAYLAARRFSSFGWLVAIFVFSTLFAWIGGGMLVTIVITESPSEAALLAMTRGIWFAVAGSAIGVFMGRRHAKKLAAKAREKDIEEADKVAREARKLLADIEKEDQHE
jgi:hypothetical protein